MQITTELVVFIVTILSIVFAAWWRIEGVIKREVAASTAVAATASSAAGAANAQALLVAAQLADHKLHVAENYITKAGMREMRDEIMTGVRELKGSVSTIHDRIDQIILAERQTNPPRAK